MTLPTPGRWHAPACIIKSSLDFAGGLFLLGFAAVGYIGGFSLPFGQLSGIGSGLLPKVVAVLVGAFGVLLLVQGLLLEGDRLERWASRGPVFVLGGVLVFAVTIRGSEPRRSPASPDVIPPLRPRRRRPARRHCLLARRQRDAAQSADSPSPWR